MYGLFVVGSFADSLEIFDVWSGSYDEGSSMPKVSYDAGFCCRIEMAFCRPRLLGARKEYAMGFSDMGEYLRIYSRISFDSAIYNVFVNTKSQVGEGLEGGYLRDPFRRHERSGLDICQTSLC